MTQILQKGDFVLGQWMNFCKLASYLVLGVSKSWTYDAIYPFQVGKSFGENERPSKFLSSTKNENYLWVKPFFYLPRRIGKRPYPCCSKKCHLNQEWNRLTSICCAPISTLDKQKPNPFQGRRREEVLSEICWQPEPSLKETLQGKWNWWDSSAALQASVANRCI